MSLAPGTRIGPYVVQSLLGRGGMGEVYRAEDARLGRYVALKTLPDNFASDPDRLRRFEREAKTLASLNHPHIAQIHGVEESGGVRALVMELVDGEDLAVRIARGPLPLDEVIAIAKQVADALDAAHGAGIVHRDLKPANIKLRPDGTVKVLDFGLAKAIAAEPAGPPSVHSAAGTYASPTVTSPAMTEMGMVLGTAAYMSPEQAKGKPLDHRADIWAFGAIVFEMITGRAPFAGETVSETLAAVIKDDVQWTALPAGLPSSMGRMLRRCLEKDPKRRLSSIADARLDLDDVSAAPDAGTLAAPRRGSSMWMAAAAAGLLGAAAGAALMSLADREDKTPGGSVLRAVVPLPGLAANPLLGKDDATLAASPDGRLLAYVNESRSAIVVHDLTTGGSRTIPQTGEVGAPFFSPDGRSVAYVAGTGGSIRQGIWGSLMKMPLSGGAPTTVVEGITGLKGAMWGDDGWIYYSPAPAFGLWRVRADGGEPEMLTQPDAAGGEKTHRLPFVVPGGKAVLFVVGTSRITSFDEARIEVLRLSDRSRHRLIDGGTAPHYVATGHLVYHRGGQLLAVRFDPETLAVRGEAFPVADGVEYFPPSGTSYHTVSAAGTLFFAPRQQASSPNALLAIDDRGSEVKLADAPFTLASGSVAPDGRRIALDPDGATQQIAIVDLARNTVERVTFEWDNVSPRWTDDGSRLIFRSSIGGGPRRLHWQASDGSGAPEALSHRSRDEIPTDVHGGRVLYEDVDPKTRTDIWLMSLEDRKPLALVQTPFDEAAAQFSPDGGRIAYQANQSGAWEIYVQALDGTTARVQASHGGGVRPLWHPSGRSLTFLKGRDVMRVAFDASRSQLALPVKLFTLQRDDLLLDVLPDDGRLVVLRRAPRPPTTAINAVANWFTLIREAERR